MSAEEVTIALLTANFLTVALIGGMVKSINRHLATVADHAERQTKLLASIANTQSGS